MHRFNKEFVFSNQPRQRLARHGLFWLICTLYFAGTYAFLPVTYLVQRGINGFVALALGFRITLVDAVLFLPAHMFFTYAILYWLLPRYLFKERYLWTVVNLMLLLFLTSIISACLTTFVVDPLRVFMGIGGRPSGNNFFFAIMAGMRGATTVGGFAAAIKLAKIWYLKQEAYQQVEHEKLQAELQLLKSQIHPHFLFNTLNNLYGLTLHKSDHSPEVVLRLSELLSYMLYDCNAAEVPLEKEIAFMRNYISLEQLRYGERLDLSLRITGDYQTKSIAPLLLVPFLENAFKHGTSEQLEQAWMHIDLSLQDNQLKFKVINGREVSEQSDIPVGGIGLQNVQKRLQLLYENRHELRIVAEEESFMIALTLALLPTPLATLQQSPQVAEPV